MGLEQHRISIRIDEEGNVELEIQGVKGKGCEKLAEMFKELGDVELGCKTSEFYEEPKLAEKVRSKDGPASSAT